MQRVKSKFRLLGILGIFILCGNIAFSNVTLLKIEDNIFDDVSIISIDKIENIIIKELVERDIDNTDLKLIIRKYKKGIKLKNIAKEYEVIIDNFSLNENARSFRASFVFKANDLVEKININGRYEQLVMVPVLRYKMPNKVEISEDDIEWIKYPSHKIKFDTVLDEELLIGKALRISMPANRPIRQRSLIRPMLIHKNDIVEIIYESKFIKLKTLGIAIDNGGLGDYIRIKNQTSNKITKARVIDKNIASVTTINNFR